MKYFKIVLLFALIVAMSGCAGLVDLKAFGYGIKTDLDISKIDNSDLKVK